MRTSAAPMPTAGVTNCWTVERDHLGEIRHRHFAAVVLPVRIGDEGGCGVPRQRRGDGTEVLRVEGQRALQPQEGIGQADREAREDDDRAGIALPGLLLLRAGTEQPVDGALDEAQVVHPSFEDRHHVSAEIAPDERQGDEKDDESPEEAHLEPLRLEHGDAEVDEDQTRDREQDDLDGAHTRPNAQMRPENTAMNATTLTTARKSAMRQLSGQSYQQEMNSRPFLLIGCQQIVTPPTASATTHCSDGTVHYPVSRVCREVWSAFGGRRP